MSENTDHNVLTEELGEDGVYVSLEQKEGNVITSIIVFESELTYSQLLGSTQIRSTRHRNCGFCEVIRGEG